MTWQCRFVEHPPLRSGEYYAGTVHFEQLAVGDICWYHHDGVPCGDAEHLRKMNLTAHYFTKNAQRPPLVACLPGFLYFLVDGQCYSGTCVKCGRERHRSRGNKGALCQCGDAYKPRGHYDGWVVSGKAPAITVRPSIHYPDYYHGHLVDGVLSNDVDGRKFDAQGRAI